MLENSFAHSEDITSFLIDSYFRHFHKIYPVLHEATFRAQHSEVVPRPSKEPWALLSRTVFVIGAWCSGYQITKSGTNHEPFDCLHMFENIGLFRTGCLTMVQAITLLSCYLHKQNKSNTASIYLGAALKMAMSLGLHKEFPEWKIDHLDREMRRRVWWCLYVMESGHCIAMGRQILLPRVCEMDILWPLNITEQV